MSKNTPTVQQTSLTLVKQPYAITMAKHSFNVHEMRIMTRITESLQKDMKYGKTRMEIQKTLFGDKLIHIPTKLLLRDKDSNNYSAVKRALKSLESKTMTIVGKDKHGEYETTVRLIMKSKYYLNNEMVEIQLDRDVLPDYLALASYSKYLVEVSIASSSSYIMRLYQFVAHWRDKTKKTVTIEELRNVLELGDKYSKPKDLRKHILEPCIKDLKQRADVWFEIASTIKSGRSITGYVFNIYCRENAMRHDASAHEVNLINTLTVLFAFKDHHIRQVQHILVRGELHSHIYAKLGEIKAQIQKGGVRNVVAYVLTSLHKEFGPPPTGHNEVHALGTSTMRQRRVPSYNGRPAEERRRSTRSERGGETASIGEHMRKIAQDVSSTSETSS